MEHQGVSGAGDQGSAAVFAAATAPSGFRLRTSPTFGLGIVTTNEHGHEVLVATVQRRDQAEKLLALSIDQVGAAARWASDHGGALLTKTEYEAMRRDVENWRQLEDDIAAGKKIVTDVPASEVDGSGGGGGEKPGVLRRVFGGRKKH
jgi:hypothetical protein